MVGVRHEEHARCGRIDDTSHGQRTPARFVRFVPLVDIHREAHAAVYQSATVYAIAEIGQLHKLTAHTISLTIFDRVTAADIIKGKLSL